MPTDFKTAPAAISLSPTPGDDESSAAKLLHTPYADSHHDDENSDDLNDHRQHHDDSNSSPSPPSRHLSWSTTRSNTNRLSTTRSNYSRHSTSPPDGSLSALISDAIAAATNLVRLALAFYARLSALQRALAIVGVILVAALGIIGMVFSHQIFAWMAPIARGWRELPGGWILLFLLTCATAFPPVIGYSTACTTAGFVFGFPGGWPIVAAASVVGSGAAFVTSRTVFARYVQGLVGADKRFVALGQVLKKDGLGVLALVRFCPLPFSLSNGFLATVPSISPWSFAAATGLASPKLLVHVFIGSRVALLVEKGDEMTFRDKMINYTFMAVSGLIGTGVGIFIYKRTMARAAILAREEELSGRPESALRSRRNGGSNGDDDQETFADAHGQMMDPDDADVAALMEDDDISLWDQGDDAYVDEETAIGGNGHDRMAK